MNHDIFKFKVWWCTRLSITDDFLEYYYFNNLDDCKQKLNELIERDLKDKKITDNIGGLMIYKNGDWEEWENEDGDDIFADMDADIEYRQMLDEQNSNYWKDTCGSIK